MHNVCECSDCDTGKPLYGRVQRWDVYDIADELADVPRMFRDGCAACTEDAIQVIKDLVERLRAAADRGGKVGPAPEYQEV